MKKKKKKRAERTESRERGQTAREQNEAKPPRPIIFRLDKKTSQKKRKKMSQVDFTTRHQRHSLPSNTIPSSAYTPLEWDEKVQANNQTNE